MSTPEEAARRCVELFTDAEGWRYFPADLDARYEDDKRADRSRSQVRSYDERMFWHRIKTTRDSMVRLVAEAIRRGASPPGRQLCYGHLVSIEKSLKDRFDSNDHDAMSEDARSVVGHLLDDMRGAGAGVVGLTVLT